MSFLDSPTGQQLFRSLQQLNRDERLSPYRQTAEQLVEKLALPYQELAALLLMHQHNARRLPPSYQEEASNTNVKPSIQNHRSVRYRLEIGTQHQVDEELLLRVLIEESGVERKRITRLEIREQFTLVDLPDGMPADIFQILSETEINGQTLKIKRLKSTRRKFKPQQRRAPKT
jgi:DbpA RNA binding domain